MYMPPIQMFAFGGFWPFAFKALPSGLMHICDQGRFLVVFGGEDKSSIGWTAWWLWPHRMMMITIIVLWGAIEYLSRDSKRCLCFSVDWPSNWHIDRKTILPKKTPTQKSPNRAEEVQWYGEEMEKSVGLQHKSSKIWCDDFCRPSFPHKHFHFQFAT